MGSPLRLCLHVLLPSLLLLLLIPRRACAIESGPASLQTCASPFGSDSDSEGGLCASGLQQEGEDTAAAAAEEQQWQQAGRVIQLSAWAPRAYLFKAFLSEAECDHIVAIASPRLKRSQVVDGSDGHEGESEVHTSSGMFVDKAEDPIIARIEQRISLWTFLPLANQESLQVLGFGAGQNYDSHHNHFND